MSITSTSCKALVTDASKGPVREYFALVHWHEDSKQFDISVTDGHSAWSAAGCSMTYPLHVTAEEAWNRCKTALSDVTQPSSAPQYIIWSAEQSNKSDGSPDQLQLVWGWGSSLLGREVMRVVPLLVKEAEAAAAVRDIMRHMLTSYSLMKTAVVECQQAQQQLERSLAEKAALLQQTAEARQEQEKVLFTKFAMLLNKKTERIVQLTETLEQQAQRLERLQGSDEHDTDDEAREAAAIYEAETEDESDQDQQEQQLAATLPGKQQQQQQQQWHSATVPGFDVVAAGGASRGDSAAAADVGPGMQQQQEADVGMPDADAGEPSALACATRTGPFADDQATQPLDANVRAMLDMQHKQQVQEPRHSPVERLAAAAGLNPHRMSHGVNQAAPAVDVPRDAQAVPPAVVASAQPRPGGIKRRIAR